MKVVIINNMPAPYRTDFYNYLNEKNIHDFTVIYSSSNEDNRNWGKDINIKHKYKILKSKTIKINKKIDFKYIHIPTNIISNLKDLNPDIIIGHEYNPTVSLAFRWAKKNNKKYISWSDGTLNSEKSINPIQKYLRKKICRNSDAFIASSTKTKEAQVHYGADVGKIYTSYLTVDINKYWVNKTEYDNSKIIFVGSLIIRKGIDLLFNALKDVKSNYTLNIIGNGPEEDNLKRLANELNISAKVNFLGFRKRDEIVKLYKEAGIFVLPTREDCFGLVITEAMCSGLPVVVSKYADGAYDLIDEGKNGYIVDPYDSKELGNKIEYLLSNKNKVIEMGKCSQEKVKNFSIENVSKDYLKAIESVKQGELK